jgi:hypothetical protein
MSDVEQSTNCGVGMKPRPRVGSAGCHRALARRHWRCEASIDRAEGQLSPTAIRRGQSRSPLSQGQAVERSGMSWWPI